MERLSAMDLSMLWPDDLGWPQDIGALAILDGSGLLDSDGRFRIDAVRAAIDSRLHLVRRFRQVLYVPRRGLGWPLWVDAPAFELGDHVRVLPLPQPADEAQVLQAVERLRRRRLDRSRPLWEMWFLPGLTDGRVGMFMKVHHAVADGVAGVATLGAFLDAVPDAAASPAPPWTPVPAPSTRQLLEDNLRRRHDSLRRVFRTISHPVSTATTGTPPSTAPGSRSRSESWVSTSSTPASATRYPSRSAGYSGGSGTYTPPASRTATSAVTRSAPRSMATPTGTSAVTPRDRRKSTILSTLDASSA